MGPGTQPLVIAREMRRRGHSVSFATSGGPYTDTVRAADFPVHIIPELAPSKHNPFAITIAILKLRKIIQDVKKFMHKSSFYDDLAMVAVEYMAQD